MSTPQSSDPKWEVSGQVLHTVTGKGSRVPSAGEIFAHVFKDQDPTLPLPGEERRLGLRFSKYPIQLHVVFGVLGRDSEPEIRLVARTRRGSSEQTIESLESLQYGHIVIADTWYPLEDGEFKRVSELMRRAGIDRLGSISLGALVRLKSMLGEPRLSITGSPETSIRLLSQRTEFPVEADLYPYQMAGVRWLGALVEQDMGGILADEMGLGKTLQVIAVLAAYQRLRPALVVAPTTLLENWRREISRFAPQLDILLHHGSQRTGFPAHLAEHAVVLTSYETATVDHVLLSSNTWGSIVLDEAQHIRNPDTRRRSTIDALPSRLRIAMTGTPVENSLLDLWSIADIVVPGYLGSSDDFEERFENTIPDAEYLSEIAGPFILRREVADVAQDLPERIDIAVPVGLSDMEAELYEQTRRSVEEEFGAAAGFAGLVRLRQFCAHPALPEGTPVDPAATSQKYRRLCEILIEATSTGEKCLVFTAFLEMIDILLADLPVRLGGKVFSIDGRTPVEKRQSIVDRFSEDPLARVLVLNPRAGGTGLNITAATHVIHYTPEWNPAIQDQASARAHRRGQTAPVRIHQLFAVGTVEEVMIERLSRKREIADAAVATADSQDVLRALSVTPGGDFKRIRAE